MACDPEIERNVRANFARQGLMAHLGAEILTIDPGYVVIAAPIRPETGQQAGFAHAGLTFSIGDSAAGYAALTERPPDEDVLTVEMKINLLRPASGTRLVATGRVLRPGRRIVAVAAEIHAESGRDRVHVATMLGTMAVVPRER